MANENNKGGQKDIAVFEFQLLTDTERPKPFLDLETTPLAKQLGLAPEQTNGHWCSGCRGIWFGYTLEAECPVCGNRHG